MKIKKCDDQLSWDRYVNENDGHPLQLWGWGEVKSANGWTADRFFVYSEGDEVVSFFQVLTKRMPWPLRAFSYVPRGIVGEGSVQDEALRELGLYLRSEYGSVVLTIEPDSTEAPRWLGRWRKTPNNILLADTATVDLTKDEAELVSVIERKRRYDIRRSMKKISRIGEVSSAEDLTKIISIYRETANRAGFDLHDEDYYADIHRYMKGASRIFAAYGDDGDPVAFVWLAVSGSVAFELYGGVNTAGQGLRANYGLKWWCVTKMQSEGVRLYDMNGLLNEGINNFKLSFTDGPTRMIGAYDLPLTGSYWLWRYGLPMMKKIRRYFVR